MQVANVDEAVPLAPSDQRLAVANARWYFAGLAASLLGNSAMSLVAGIWVKSLTGSSSQAGWCLRAYMPGRWALRSPA